MLANRPLDGPRRRGGSDDMTFLNTKIRAIYAGALGAVGLAVGSALDPLSARSQNDQATAAPTYLKAARTSAKAPTGSQKASAPVRVVNVERKIEGKPITWWRARAV